MKTLAVVAAILLCAGCYMPYELRPESEAWRTSPPPNIPLPVMEHCLTDAEGTTCQCHDPFKRMQPIRCYDEV